MDEQQNNQPVIPQEPSQVPPSVPDTLMPPSSPVMPVAVVGGISGKVIAIIVGLLIVVGSVGAYFIFSNKTPTTTSSDQVVITTSSSVTSQQSTAGTASFHCSDLLSESDFKLITGLNSSDFDFKEAPYPDHVFCNWLGRGNEQGTSFAEKFGTAGKAYNIVISWGDESIKGLFPGDELLKSVYSNIVFIRGIGSEAWILSDNAGKTGGALTVLSSSKKYTIVVTDVRFDLPTEKRLAMVIDANLNKY